jgi:signal transduction histidine kinase
VSHDLKNPVSVISGVSEVLRASWDSIAPERRDQMIDSLVRSSRAMRDMLQRDLDAALIESGELSYDIAPLDLADTARGVVDSFRDSEPGREFVLNVDKDLPLALGDPRRHSQILYNLLSNALKFSEPDTSVTIDLRRSDGMLEVSVTDQGRGIAEADRAVLFERLARLHPGTAGSGLGLYIARSMVESQGGTMWVDSEPGKGSRFTYTAPVA